MKLQKLSGLISKKYKESSTCESCGDEFTCGATLKGCWCFSVKISEDSRKELKSKFKNCLCQNCLKKISQQKI